MKMFKFLLKKLVRTSGVFRMTCVYSTASSIPQIGIIGSGPSGFVISQTLLKNHSAAKIDMYEKLPVPFGLIRYGVSPDHQDVKNCIHGYTKTAESERFSFFGNVNIGKDISLAELCQAYHAVVICTGAQGEIKLGVPGDHLQNVFSSNQIVGWYNGVPGYQDLNVNLSGKTAVIIGVGNVALDVARLLMKHPEQLKRTDITEEAFSKLSNSKIKNVHIVGRRGPLQMACTRRELSEITDMPDVMTFIEPEHYEGAVQTALKKKDLTLRKRQRLISYLQKVATVPTDNIAFEKGFYVKLLRSIIRLDSENGNSVSSVMFQKRKQCGNDAFHPIITDTSTTEKLNCDLVISCIGYTNSPIDKQLIPFENGKIVQKSGQINMDMGLYTCGWCSHGPKGVLADSGNDSLLTGSTILSDLPMLLAKKTSCTGSGAVLKILESKNVNYVNWKGWEKIDDFEIKLGNDDGKIREKVTSVEKMVSIAND